MTGIENHQRRNPPAPSPMAAFAVVEAVLQGVITLVVLLGAVVWWVWKRL